jgi:hypothetical protein
MATISITSFAIGSSSSVLVSSVNILKSAVLEDTSDIKPMFSIDSIPLSEHNRKTSFSNNINSISNERANGRRGVYFNVSNNKRTFSIDWSFLPGKQNNTVDLGAGRDFIKKIADDPRSHTLKIRNLNANGLTSYTEESYNVLVVSYSEDLIRRDLNNDEYYWNCSISLQEV